MGGKHLIVEQKARRRFGEVLIKHDHKGLLILGEFYSEIEEEKTNLKRLKERDEDFAPNSSV